MSVDQEAAAELESPGGGDTQERQMHDLFGRAAGGEGESHGKIFKRPACCLRQASHVLQASHAHMSAAPD